MQTLQRSCLQQGFRFTSFWEAQESQLLSGGISRSALEATTIPEERFKLLKPHDYLARVESGELETAQNAEKPRDISVSGVFVGCGGRI